MTQLPSHAPLDVSSRPYASYSSREGQRNIMIVRYGESCWAIFDERRVPVGRDYDERLVASGVTSMRTAQLLAEDYLGRLTAGARERDAA